MAQSNEIKYILISEHEEGIGAIHKEAICHMAYATALDALGVSSYLTSEQIRKYSPKKTTLVQNGDELEIEIKIPIKRDLNAYDLMQEAQNAVQQNFSNFLSLTISKVNIVVDQVVF